jgi:HD-GYP domain-containing protein (c-di-GMP phosphodiesterase class II)
MIEKATKIVSCFVSGMNDYLSPRSDQKSVSTHVEKALDIIRALQIEHFFTITASDDNTMLINGIRMSLDTPEVRKFFMKLRQKGIVTIVISKGVRAGELQKFLSDLASSGGIFHSYAHIAIKRGEQLPQTHIFPPKHELRDDLFQIKLIYRDISAKGRIDMTTVDAVVARLIATVRKEEGLFSPLMPTKEGSDDLHIHSAKTAMFSILQGEHLGLGNALLYDIGLAALLHDAGKILLPHTLLEKQDSLSESEWIIMKEHPVHGAALLASLHKIPEIAIIVAYEHHKKYDGTGYPESKRRPGKQHIISQIVAIADYYCALSNDLPHRKPLSHASILGLLVESTGKEFNPLLVDNFVRAMQKSCLRVS